MCFNYHDIIIFDGIALIKNETARFRTFCSVVPVKMHSRVLFKPIKVLSCYLLDSKNRLSSISDSSL
jgi:hypothetical protein